jgi:WD40 repeat protein
MPQNPVSYVGYSPNGRFVLAGTLDSKLRLWDVTTKYHPAATSSFLTTGIPSVASGSYRKPSTLRCTKTYSGGHVNSKFCTFAAFAAAGPKERQYIVSGSEDGKVYLYGLNSRKVVQVLDGHGSGNNKEGDGTHNTSTSNNNSSGNGGDQKDASNGGGDGSSSGSGPVLAVAAHAKQEMIASGGMTLDKTVRVWVPAWINRPDELDEGGDVDMMAATAKKSDGNDDYNDSPKNKKRQREMEEEEED